MTEAPWSGRWELLCTIERAERDQSVVEQVRTLLPDDRHVRLALNTDGSGDVWCSPPLAPDERARFEQAFEDRDFTDLAYLVWAAD